MGPLKIGIAGLGHVGCGLIELVERQDKLRLPGRVEIAGVSARSKSRNRPVDTDKYRWFDDAATLAEDADVDVFIELIGGSDGPAKFAVESALKAGKHVITANKALMAKHGMALASLAEEKASTSCSKRRSQAASRSCACSATALPGSRSSVLRAS